MTGMSRDDSQLYGFHCADADGNQTVYGFTGSGLGEFLRRVLAEGHRVGTHGDLAEAALRDLDERSHIYKALAYLSEHAEDDLGARLAAIASEWCEHAAPYASDTRTVTLTLPHGDIDARRTWLTGALGAMRNRATALTEPEQEEGAGVVVALADEAFTLVDRLTHDEVLSVLRHPYFNLGVSLLTDDDLLFLDELAADLGAEDDSTDDDR